MRLLRNVCVGLVIISGACSDGGSSADDKVATTATSARAKSTDDESTAEKSTDDEAKSSTDRKSTEQKKSTERPTSEGLATSRATAARSTTSRGAAASAGGPTVSAGSGLDVNEQADLGYTPVDPAEPDATCRAAVAAQVQMSWYYRQPTAFDAVVPLFLQNLDTVRAGLSDTVSKSVEPYLLAWKFAAGDHKTDPLFSPDYAATRRAFFLWASIRCPASDASSGSSTDPDS